jgi:hypothetical protein
VNAFAVSGLVKRHAELAGEIKRFVADMPQGRREFEVVTRHHFGSMIALADEVLE